MTKDEVYRKLIDQYGKDEYTFKIVEELNELSCAILHYRHGKIELTDLASEIADAMIQIEKIFVLHPTSHSEYIIQYDKKMKQLKRLVGN